MVGSKDGARRISVPWIRRKACLWPEHETLERSQCLDLGREWYGVESVFLNFSLTCIRPLVEGGTFDL
jgi:hypothetical protein